MAKRIQTVFHEKGEPKFTLYSVEPYDKVQTDPPEYLNKLDIMGLARFNVMGENGERISLDKDKDPYKFIRYFWRHFYGFYASASEPEVIRE